MHDGVRFILNAADVAADAAPGTTVLDFVRGERRLCGTKVGCREGDCGACTVLVGEWRDGAVAYRSMTSCLLPLANVHGKHVLTIEGINAPAGLTPVQHAIADEGGTQCGFCTVGFVVSLTGYCLDRREPGLDRALAAIDGNICRCTGYKSLERAAARITELLATRPEGAEPIAWLVSRGVLPESLAGIGTRLAALGAATRRAAAADGGEGGDGGETWTVAGGTDLYVQRPEAMPQARLAPVFDDAALRGVRVAGGRCTIGAATTFEELRDEPVLQHLFPRLRQHLELVASTPIRNMATLGGNLVNASPIGDMTIFFLAQDAEIELRRPGGARWLPLRRFYKGYKTLDRTPGEIVGAVRFAVPGPGTRVHFEKVSKRTHLDIASVNSAARFELDGDTIARATLSAGGVAPIPMVLERAGEFLRGRRIDAATAVRAADIAVGEIRPIDDARGSAEYKALLLRQLVWAHFLTLFPDRVALAELLA
jgi:xanthine dehydrogenase small subunit